MRVCIIAEKPSLATEVVPHVLALHPDLDPDAFACAYVHPYVHLNASFLYPRGLAWADYPFTGDARYRPFRLGESGNNGMGRMPRPRFLPNLERTRYENGREGWAWSRPEPSFADPDGEAMRRLARAEIVYAVMDPGPSSWLAATRCLDAILPAGGRADVRFPVFDGLAEERVRAAVAAPCRPGDERHARFLAYARLRRRFDYAYQVNALAVHGRALRLAGAAPDALAPTKYALQALYDLRGAGALSEGRWAGRMQDWRGTGRYPTDHGAPWYRIRLGSPASYHEIMLGLERAGLAERCGGPSLGLSDLGRRFLGLLHPGSEDRDLPFRLHAWAMDADDGGRERADRYLRTFFGRQIRFMARVAAGNGADAGIASS